VVVTEEAAAVAAAAGVGTAISEGGHVLGMGAAGAAEAEPVGS
jgi:hypothetical protein